MKITYIYSGTLKSTMEVTQDENTGFINVRINDLSDNATTYKVGNKYLVDFIRIAFSKAGYQLLADELLTEQWIKHGVTLIEKFNETRELKILMDCYKGYTFAFIRCLAEGDREIVQQILEILLEVK